MGTSPFGPFKRIGTILAQDGKISGGAGHQSVVNLPGTDEWYIAYHRRPLGETDGHHREMAIGRLYFNEDGTIRPVVMTMKAWRRSLSSASANGEGRHYYLVPIATISVFWPEMEPTAYRVFEVRSKYDIPLAVAPGRRQGDPPNVTVTA